MRTLINILIGLAGVSFILAIVFAILHIRPLFGLPAASYWKFTIGCLGFAIVLTLSETLKKQ